MFPTLAGLVVFIIFWICGWLPFLFGIFIPYVAILMFIGGFIYKVAKWGKSPVPFRIPTTCGQAKSLPWFKQDKLEAPHTTWQVIGRLFMEVVFFRSLFRNTKAELKPGPQMVYGSSKWLWVAAIAFHWCFLVIFLRHLRFFAEPVPFFVQWIEALDGMFQIGVPTLYLTDAVIIAALGYLLWRRLYDAKIKYISLPADYFALLLLLGIVISGVLVRHVFKVDIVEAKKLAVGLFTLSPSMPEGLGFWFYVHLLLLSVFFAYFPFSKLMHMPGVFMSPTRNLANNNRERRHINPWNYPVKVHTYEEYEDEFRDKMKAAGMPLDKE
ncbi:MAG: sulfate reduction electron transfer complex DsrMKJOP subunit DsrM [Planctomycetota bacterium]|jgi:nitrate reductase gamma subunit